MADIERSRQAARLVLRSLDDPEASFVRINAGKPFKYKSGGFHPFYANFREGQAHPKTRRALVGLMANHISESPISVSGLIPVPQGATPWAAIISYEMNIPTCTPREQAKDHGIQTAVDGMIHADRTYGVVEDLISTGGSAISVVRNMRGLNVRTGGVFSFMTYEWPQATQNFRQLAAEIHGDEDASVLDPLIPFTILFEEAVDLGVVKDSQREIILDWRRSSDDWDIRHGFRQPPA